MPKEHLPERKYQLWSTPGQAKTPPGRATLHTADLPRLGNQKPKRNISLSTAQRADLDNLNTSLLMYGHGLPLHVVLEGLCTFGKTEPAKCKTRRVSSEAVDIQLELNPLSSWFKPRVKLPDGTNVRLKLKEIGAFNGSVVSQNKAGYRVSVDQAYRRELGEQLVELAVKQGFGSKSPIGGVARIEPLYKNCNFIDHTNTLRRGSIVSLSQTDVILRAAIIPPLQANITFRGPRGLKAKVIERYEIGFLAQFSQEIPRDAFSEKFRLSDI